MERDHRKNAKMAIDGGGGAQSSCQGKCRQICQNPGSINNLASLDALRHYLSRGLQSSLLGSYLAQILRVSWKKVCFFKELGQFPSKFVALLSFLAAAITTILSSSSHAVAQFCFGAVSYAFITKTLQIKLLRLFCFISSLKKARRNRLICRNFRDSLASLSRSVPWKGGRLQRPHSGAILMLLALFVPIILCGVKYSEYLFEYRQKSLNTPVKNGPIYKACAKEAALAVAKEWNPALTFEVQKEAAYKIADAIYNAAPAHQTSALGYAIPGLSGAKESDLPASRKTIAVDANGKRTSAFGDPPVIVALENDRIKVTTDNDVAYAVPAQCNVDVVLAVPTNADASLADIKTACANFIEDNFYYTRGVYFSVIPYSGRLSISSERRAAWADQFPAFKENASQQLLIGACLYATIGRAGTALTTRYSASSTTACPIMFRRGTEKKEAKYGDNPYYFGDLFSTANPTSAAAKYLQMNLQPCTLSNASLLSMKCISACSSFSANPNFMLEPAADLTEACITCNSLESGGDKSNFIFAALEWANNMFQEWTKDPATANDGTTLSSLSKMTPGRKKAVIVIVNKPDHFEPNEMTYLGFSDDYLETNSSTETIDFRQNLGTEPKSEHGALKFSGASYSSGSYRCTSETTCTLTCAKKRNVKLVIAPADITMAGEITFTNVNNTSSTDKVKKDTLYYVLAEREFFIEEGSINANSTITFRAKNIKFVSATITSRTINSGTEATCTKSESRSALTITTNCKRRILLKLKPKKLKQLAEKKHYITLDGQKYEIPSSGREIKLDNKKGNIEYLPEYAKISGKPELKISVSGEETDEEETLGEGQLELSIDRDLPDKTYAIRFVPIDYISQLKVTLPHTYYLYGSNRTNLIYLTLENKTKTLNTGDKVVEFITQGTNHAKFGITSALGGTGQRIKVLALYKGMSDSRTTTTYPDFTDSIIKLGDKTGQLILKVDQTSIPTETVAINPKITYTKSDGSSSATATLNGAQSITVEVGNYEVEAGTQQTVTIDPNTYHFKTEGTQYKISLNLYDIWSVDEVALSDYLKIFSLNSETSARSGTGNVVLRNATGEVDPTEGAKSATSTACTKLASGTRLYFVKYKGSGSDTDYAYLNACAEKTGGKMVSANDAVELKQRLDEIAADVKSKEFANASGAAVVR